MWIFVLELIGISVFAVSGTLAAGRKRLDLIGVLVLALVTAMGGGTVRDLLLDRHPLIWLADPTYLFVIVASALLTMAYVRWRRPPEKSLLVADALGLALFSITGAQIAQRAGMNPVSCVLLATVTGSAGGILRDVLTAEIPLLFRPSALYASAAMAGASMYLLLEWLGAPRPAPMLVGIVVVAALRLAAIWWRISLPVFQLERDGPTGN